MSLSFVKLVLSWLKHSLLTGLAVSKESVMCSDALSLWTFNVLAEMLPSVSWERLHLLMGEIELLVVKWSEWHSSQVNHDPKLLRCLSCFTISITGKDERKQEINVKLLLLSKTLINAGTSVPEIYRSWILQVPEKRSTTTRSVSLLYFWRRE